MIKATFTTIVYCKLQRFTERIPLNLAESFVEALYCVGYSPLLYIINSCCDCKAISTFKLFTVHWIYWCIEAMQGVRKICGTFLSKPRRQTAVCLSTNSSLFNYIGHYLHRTWRKVWLMLSKLKPLRSSFQVHWNHWKVNSIIMVAILLTTIPYCYTKCRVTYILANQRLQAPTLINLYRIISWYSVYLTTSQFCADKITAATLYRASLLLRYMKKLHILLFLLFKNISL